MYQFSAFSDKMGCVKYLSFLLVLTLSSLVQGKKMCNSDDAECLTNGAKNFYKTLLAGADYVEPLDPIHVDELKEETPGGKYKITNATLSELKNCEVTKLKYNKQDLSFEYSLLCPQLFLNFRYEVKGLLGTMTVDGVAEEKVTLDDYFIIFKGKYALLVSEKDKKRRAAIKSYVVETEPRGKFTFETTNLIRGSKQKVDDVNAFANENWRAMEKIMKSPLLEAFFKMIVDKANIHLKEIPIEDILSQE